MYDLIRLATTDLARFLGAHLPSLSPDCWKKHLIDLRAVIEAESAMKEGDANV